MGDKFRTVERRISGNEDNTRFRVQYKKNGKARANILRSIEDARKLRDSTDTPETKEQIKKGTLKDVVNVHPEKKATPANKVVEALQDSDNADLKERCLSLLEKILSL